VLDAHGLGVLGDTVAGVDVDFLVGFVVFVGGTDQVDDDVGILHAVLDTLNVVHIVGDGDDLTEITVQFELSDLCHIASVRDDDMGADVAELADDVLAEETSSTEDSDDKTVDTVGTTSLDIFGQREVGERCEISLSGEGARERDRTRSGESVG
jgi:hypothetical protein